MGRGAITVLVGSTLSCDCTSVACTSVLTGTALAFSSSSAYVHSRIKLVYCTVKYSDLKRANERTLKADFVRMFVTELLFVGTMSSRRCDSNNNKLDQGVQESASHIHSLV